MIVRSRPGLLTLFFVLKGSIILRTWPQLFAVGLLSVIVVAAHRHAPDTVPGINPAPMTLIGIALSVFLSFRNMCNRPKRKRSFEADPGALSGADMCPAS